MTGLGIKPYFISVASLIQLQNRDLCVPVAGLSFGFIYDVTVIGSGGPRGKITSKTTDVHMSLALCGLLLTHALICTLSFADLWVLWWQLTMLPRWISNSRSQVILLPQHPQSQSSQVCMCLVLALWSTWWFSEHIISKCSAWEDGWLISGFSSLVSIMFKKPSLDQVTWGPQLYHFQNYLIPLNVHIILEWVCHFNNKKRPAGVLTVESTAHYRCGGILTIVCLPAHNGSLLWVCLSLL